MSGSIRKFLGPTRARALTYLRQAKELLEGEPRDLSVQEAAIEDMCARLSRCTATMTKCNDDRTAVLVRLEGQAKEAENQEYDQFMGIVNIILDCDKYVARLQTVLNRHCRVRERPLQSRHHSHLT